MKNFKEFTTENIDNIDMDKVQKCYDTIMIDDNIYSLFDEEVMNWVEDDWDEEYDSEYEWYVDFGRGEAEDVVFHNLMQEFPDLNFDEKSELRDMLADETGLHF